MISFLSDSKEESSRYLRLALPLMTKHAIPITPQNYLVWYQYVAGRNLDLATELDADIASDSEFDDCFNRKLYEKYFESDDGSDLSSLQHELRNVLSSVVKNTKIIGNDTQSYCDNLKAVLDLLNDEASESSLKLIAAEIQSATESQRQSIQSTAESFKEATVELEELRDQFENVTVETESDFLTGLANSNAFVTRLEAYVSKIRNEQNHLCVVLFEVDGFSTLNGKFGNLVTDEILRFTSRAVCDAIRGRDFVARIDTNRFAIILPDTTEQGASTVSKNILEAFPEEGLRKRSDGTSLGQVTVSVGFVHYRWKENYKSSMRRADIALKRAIQLGGNRVEMGRK